VSALSSLKAGARTILLAEGKGEIASYLASVDVERSGESEQWAMGSRVVVADRLVLTADAPVYLALTADGGTLDVLRSAFERAMRTPETALADLSIVLRLPGVNVGWHQVYRMVPQMPRVERSAPDRVLAGAIALLRARVAAASAASGLRPPAASAASGLPPAAAARAAAVLERAEMEAAPVGSTDGILLVRLVLRLTAEDFVRAEADEELAEEARRAVFVAGTRAAERVASVDFAVRLPG